MFKIGPAVVGRAGPHDYGDPFNLANHPVVGITWYEALAFTRWLTQRWQAEEKLSSNWLVDLPSEIEWEKAARGGFNIPEAPLINPVNLEMHRLTQIVERENADVKRPFPWGSRLPQNRANFSEYGLTTSSAVGCFPGAQSPYGCEEMSGNVWEWTRSHYKNYPYDQLDGREDKNVKLFHQMTLRGGAFWSDAERIRCVARIRRAPNDRNDNYGFRIVIRGAGKRG